MRKRTKGFFRLPWHHETNRHKPRTDGVRWLYDFGQWVLNTSDEARDSLELMSHDQHFINVRGTLAAECGGHSATNSPFWIGNFTDEQTEAMEEFFCFHLAKARLEQTILVCSFWREATLTWIPAQLLDDEREGQFAPMFEKFLKSQFYLPEAWEECGLTQDDVLSAVERSKHWVGPRYESGSALGIGMVSR